MKTFCRTGITLLLLAFFVTVDSLYGQTVMDRLRSDDQVSSFTRALEAANLDSQLEQSGPYTIFAPSNKAFNQLNNVQQSNRSLLLNHIFTGMATERSLRVMTNITCLSGQTVQIDEGNSLSVNGNTFLKSNIKTENGIIHIIDGVID